MLLRLFIFIFLGLLVPYRPSKAEIWEKDYSKEVYIEASVEGLKGLHLECSKDKMKIEDIEKPAALVLFKKIEKLNFFQHTISKIHIFNFCLFLKVYVTNMYNNP